MMYHATQLLHGWLNPEESLHMAPIKDVVGAATLFFLLLISLELGASLSRSERL